MNSEFNFIEQIEKHFSFLIHDFGFWISEVSQDGDVASVRYRTEKVFVNLLRLPPDFETKLSFGRFGIDDVIGAYCFEQGDLIQLGRCHEWKWRKDSELIPELARLLGDCGKKCLEGNEQDFVEMKERRDVAIEKWHSELHESSTRARAENAWREKNYKLVISLYLTIEMALTDSERKRLAIAKKEISSRQ